MARPAIQQMRDELVSLINSYFDRAEARIRRLEERLEARKQQERQSIPQTATSRHAPLPEQPSEASFAQIHEAELQDFFASLSQGQGAGS